MLGSHNAIQCDHRLSAMSTAAEHSTGFYTTFIARLDSLQASIASAASQTDLDAVVQGIIDSREILQSKDLEGHLPNRDKELYERVRLPSYIHCLGSVLTEFVLHRD